MDTNSYVLKMYLMGFKKWNAMKINRIFKFFSFQVCTYRYIISCNNYFPLFLCIWISCHTLILDFSELCLSIIVYKMQYLYPYPCIANCNIGSPRRKYHNLFTKFLDDGDYIYGYFPSLHIFLYIAIFEIISLSIEWVHSFPFKTIAAKMSNPICKQLPL